MFSKKSIISFLYTNDDCDIEKLDISTEYLNQARPPEPVEAVRSRVKDLQKDNDLGADIDTEGVTGTRGANTVQLDADEVDHSSHSSLVAAAGHLARRILLLRNILSSI